VPEARDGKAPAGLMGGGALIPRFRNITAPAKNFIRGYAVNVYSNPGPMDPRNFVAYGQELQNKLASYEGSGFSTGLMGEVLSNYENHVSIDKQVVDAWGIPVLHIDAKYTDNDSIWLAIRWIYALRWLRTRASRSSRKTMSQIRPATAFMR
jgi:hypothetical protein